MLLSELKSSKQRGTSRNKHTASDEEDEVDEEDQSEDETDSEGEDMAGKEQSSSEDGKNWFYAGYKYDFSYTWLTPFSHQLVLTSLNMFRNMFKSGLTKQG